MFSSVALTRRGPERSDPGSRLVVLLCTLSGTGAARAFITGIGSTACITRRPPGSAVSGPREDRSAFLLCDRRFSLPLLTISTWGRLGAADYRFHQCDDEVRD
ncbi:hypothetical protein EVAR_29657_1 [Eumeta japonica]|uniref:Uncharacterized protein n=1 Tax=Eumeta variegata TaxID=151549 RepID=A0A4C1WA93_EUMVA|nr:hypothetical protein EVAR_29657_1 [Eumeta japonica]